MVRSVLASCFVLTLLGACGGSKGIPTIPQVSIPGPMAYDGSPPGEGTVTYISPLPGGDGTKFVAYEVDPAACTVKRTIVDELDALKKLVVQVITDPREGAGTGTIIRPNPPPPPDGQNLVRDARIFAGTSPTTACRPRAPSSPTHQ